MLCPKAKRRLYAGLLAGLMTVLMVQGGGRAGSVPVALTFPYNSREIQSNRYTRPEPAGDEQRSMDVDGFDRLFENRALAVYIRKETGSLRVENKTTGYVWGCLPSDKPDNLNKRWSKLGNSLIAADIYDKDGNVKTYGTDSSDLTWTVSGHTLRGDVSWKEQQISLKFTMELIEDGLRFSVDGAAVREEGADRLGSVYFLPFFGSSAEDERQGYVFVPDGCGALIRFNKAHQYLQGFEKRLYGPDYGIDQLDALKGLESNRTGEYMTDEEQLTAPLFGIVHGAKQNAFWALVEEGGAFAKLCVDPAGLITDYYRASVKFMYRQIYNQPFNKNGAGIQTVQAEPNRLKGTIVYRFLQNEEADYVGMAKEYRAVLEKQSGLQTMRPADALPLRLDFLAADVQKEFIGTSVNTITTLSEIEDTIDWLRTQNVNNLRVSLLGWQKGGWKGYRKTALSTWTVYGDLRSLHGLRDKLQQDGGSLSLELSPFTAREGQADIRGEIGISMAQSAIKKAGASNAFRADVWYLNPLVGLEAFEQQANRLMKEGYPLRIDDLGYLLYGDYLNGKETTRDAVQEQIVAAAAQLAQDEKLTLVRPADYLYQYTRAYTDIPMVSSQYLFENDTVPFLQIVLSGSMELYAPYANLSFFSGADLLKMMDYNCYPSFLLTGKDNYSLRKTASGGYHSTKRTDWQDYIAQAYGLVARILEPVRGQAIVAREIPAAGLSKTVYTGGTVYVNYTTEPLAVDNLEVPGSTALFTDGTRVERGTVV